MLLNNINLNLHITALQTGSNQAQQLLHWLRSSNMHTEAILTKLVRDVQEGTYTMLLRRTTLHPIINFQFEYAYSLQKLPLCKL